MINGPRTRPCWSQRLNSISSGSAWCRAWRPVTPDFSLPPTKRRRRSWELHRSPFRFSAPRVCSGESVKRSAGSRCAHFADYLIAVAPRNVFHHDAESDDNRSEDAATLLQLSAIVEKNNNKQIYE